MSRVSDFRSDTVTLPSERMRSAMAEAEVGDDVLDGDPTVGRLERAAADWLGKDGALFVPSGTMANQIAIGSWTRPGDEMLVERDAHVVCFEAGAVAALHGVQTSMLSGVGGALDPDDLRRALRPPIVHCPRPALVAVEQTYLGSGNGPGGRVVPLERLVEIHALATEHGLAVHMDGARLANAVAASGVDAARWAACADSVSVCLSKGLGAPVGSIVAGSEEFLERARLVRKRLGGWMRQAGTIAAAGLLALENVERLREDHELARELAQHLDALPGLSCPEGEVETNVVMVRVGAGAGLDAPALSAALGERGVRALAMGPAVLRFVTHMEVGSGDVERAEEALRAVLGAAS